MKTFKKTIEFLNRMKVIDIWGDRNEGLSNDDREYIDRKTTQNPYAPYRIDVGWNCVHIWPSVWLYSCYYSYLLHSYLFNF